MVIELGPFSLDRAWQAWLDVQQRVRRVTAAIEFAGIPYAIAGGNAVAIWVTRVDPAAVRATPDIDILIRREDFVSMRAAMESAGFAHRHCNGLETFLEPPDYRVRAGIHLLFAGEKNRKSNLMNNPDVDDSERADDFRVVSLRALVQIKLTDFRLKDRVHLRNMMEVQLIDSTWPARFTPELGQRLQSLLDDPLG